MSNFYNLDIEFPDVDFNIFYKKGENSNIKYNSHLYIQPNEIELRIFYRYQINFGKRLSLWSHDINWEKFGTFLKASNERGNERLLKIDFSESRLISIVSYGQTKIDEINTYVSVKIDSVKFYWKPILDKTNTAEFYLNDAGHRVVEPFYSVLIANRGKLYFNRYSGYNTFYRLEKGKFRFEFNFLTKDDRKNRVATITKEPRIIFKYNGLITENEAIHYCNVVLHLASFYYHAKIDFISCRIHLPEHTITIIKIKEINNSIDKIGRLIGFCNEWDFHTFLRFKWQRSVLKDFKLLSKSIELFNQALLVDRNSEYLIRFNIIEICNNLKTKNEGFTFVVNKKRKSIIYKDALNLLLEGIQQSEHEQFINKWNSLRGKMEIKPMKSPLIEFLESQNLKTKDFPIKIDELKELRDKIVHGSIDRIDDEFLRRANQLMYRINGILILNLIGINDWSLNTKLT